MKNVLWAISCAFLMTFSINAGAQNTRAVCGTPANATMDQLLKAKAMLESGFIKQRGAITYVPVKYHLVARTNQTGRVDETDVLKMHCHLNDVYEDQEIQFFIKDGEFNYINNNVVYDDHVGTQGTIMQFNRDGNAMNIFIVNDATPAGGGQSPGTVLGYYSPSRDWIVMRIDQVNANSQTLPHEAGHFFGLPHPFNGWESDPFDSGDMGWPIAPAISPNGSNPTELQDGSNCANAGDMICDTPPDYNFGLINGNSCIYSGGAKDPNGVTVNPDETLIMSYFNDNCVNKFSDDQKDIIAANLASADRNFLDNNFAPPGDVVSNDLIAIFPPDGSNAQFSNGEINLDWEDMDGANAYILEFASNQFFSDVRAYFLNESFATVDGIENLKKYYWRVRAYNWANTCAANVTSNTVSFTADMNGVSSVNNIDFVKQFTVYPNPANSGQGINVFVQTRESFDGTVALYNLTGQLVYQMKFNFQHGENIVRLPGNNIEHGVYMVHVKSGSGVLSSKVMVKR